METFLMLLAAGGCLFLAWRLRETSRIIRQLIEAARESKPLLLEERGMVARAYHLETLVRTFNDMTAEKLRISGTGREYHGQIQALLGNLREAVVMVDSSNTILSANPAFNELVKRSGDLSGRRLDALLQGAGFLEFLQETRRSGNGGRQEIQVQIEQNAFWLEISAAPLQESGGENGPYTLFVFHNITRQKKLEKMRTEFVANVSHELRTPVTIIKGFAETLLEDQAILSAEERTRFLEKIRNNSERLHSLLQDLLLLSRLESTEMVLQREKLQLGTLITEVVENWRSTQGGPEQSVAITAAPGDDWVLVDPLRISQVVTNLMENIVRHARGFQNIYIRIQPETDWVHLVIADDGCGIPEKDLPHIFQRFYRVEKGRSRESGGTGLGLSIVKHIIVQHGGSITARSGRGEGTAIEMTLPRADIPGLKVQVAGSNRAVKD